MYHGRPHQFRVSPLCHRRSMYHVRSRRYDKALTGNLGGNPIGMHCSCLAPVTAGPRVLTDHVWWLGWVKGPDGAGAAEAAGRRGGGRNQRLWTITTTRYTLYPYSVRPMSVGRCRQKWTRRRHEEEGRATGVSWRGEIGRVAAAEMIHEGLSRLL